MNLEVKNPNDLPLLSIKELIPTQGDLKDLTEANYDKLKKSFEKHGFIFPISIWQDGDKNYLIDGHQRQRVITKEYGDVEVPVIKIPAKDIKEAAEILLKVTSQYGTITQEGLDTYIATYELPEAEIYEATHYDAISYLQQEEPEVKEDEAPEVSQEEPKSKLGEIYQLGRHRVMCGDSTDKASVDMLMNGEKADMVLSDPPYGMFLDTDYSSLNWGGRKGKKYDNVIGDHEDFDPELINTFFKHFDYCKEMFLWGADYYFELLPEFKKGNYIVWDKTLQSNGDAGSNSEYELCWSRQKHKRVVLHFNWFRYFGLQSQDTKTRVHPTQKPLEVNSHFIESYSKEQDKIVDLFLGSGSTLIACEQTDRTCYGMELDPKYVDVIRKRYAKFTNNNELPENWEELTPAIERELSEANG
jgi:DNA modification methylase